MSITVVAPPTAEPVTIDEVKAHLRLVACSGDDGCDSGEDLDLLTKITAARLHCEMITRRACMPQTLRWTLDGFGRGILSPPITPVRSITSISYRDSGGATQTLSPSDYQADVRSEPARIAPAYATCWPSTRCEMAAVEIVFEAGYASAAAVPETMKLAICQLAAHWYAVRENVNVGNITGEVPWTVTALLSGLEWGSYP